MPELVRLSASEIAEKSAALTEWEVRDDGLYREFRFVDFVQAFTFMTAVAFLAERLGHHPEWSNAYNLVQIRLSTHDVDGISDNDFTMAGEISRLSPHWT